MIAAVSLTGRCQDLRLHPIGWAGIVVTGADAVNLAHNSSSHVFHCHGQQRCHRSFSRFGNCHHTINVSHKTDCSNGKQPSPFVVDFSTQLTATTGTRATSYRTTVDRRRSNRSRQAEPQPAVSRPAPFIRIGRPSVKWDTVEDPGPCTTSDSSQSP
jgi:hypothetical protein